MEKKIDWREHAVDEARQIATEIGLHLPTASSTEAVMADTDLIFSMPPASSSSTFLKIIRRMLVLAAAAVRYSSKPFKSWARKAKIAASWRIFIGVKKDTCSVVKAAFLRP